MQIAVLAVALMLSGSDAPAPDTIWPQWRGPTGDSVAPGKGLPTKWTKDDVVWKSAIPGWGNSTPAIWKDAIFVTTQVDDSELLLLRLDRLTGKIAWKQEVGKGSPRRKGPVGENRYHDEHNMATPSPVTDGIHVWAHFGNGDYACYKFDGTKVWAKNLSKDLGPYTIWWGHGNSPVLFGDLLLSVCIQDPKGGGKSYVAAHHKLTGEQKWYTERVTGATGEPADSYTTPLLFNNNGKTEMIVFGGNVLDAYEPDTGKRIWQSKPFKGNRVISGPVLVGDTVFAIQGMKGPLFAIKAGGEGDVTSSSVRWSWKGGTPDAASPVVVNGLVFLAANNGVGICIDAATGAELWKERMSTDFRATPLAAGGHIYFLAKDGTAFVVEASRKYNLVSRAEFGQEIIASPAVASGDLFVRTKGFLYRVGAK